MNYVLIGGVGGYFLYRSTYDLAGMVRDEHGNFPYKLGVLLLAPTIFAEVMVIYTHLLFSEIVEKYAQEYEDAEIELDEDERVKKAMLIHSLAKDEMLQTYTFDLARVDILWTLVILGTVATFALTATPTEAS